MLTYKLTIPKGTGVKNKTQSKNTKEKKASEIIQQLKDTINTLPS